MKRQRGFTLIELLIVIAILGVLAAVVVPNISSFLGTAQIAGANTEAMNVKTASISYLADYGEFPCNSDNLSNLGYLSANPKAKYEFDTNGLILTADPIMTDGWGDTLKFDSNSQSWGKAP